MSCKIKESMFYIPWQSPQSALLFAARNMTSLRIRLPSPRQQRLVLTPWLLFYCVKEPLCLLGKLREEVIDDDDSGEKDAMQTRFSS